MVRRQASQLLTTDERKQIARLFNFLLQGEQLAFDCATRQAKIFPDQSSRRFLLSQARQEAFHAKIFKAGIGILMPRGIGDAMGKKSMQDYRRLLESALDRGDAAESLLAMQIILEGLGDIALNRISAGIPDRGLNFKRVRQLVVGQEDAHHSFGLRRFEQLLNSNTVRLSELSLRADDYLELAGKLVTSVAPLFEYFEEDPKEYLQELLQTIPQNISREAA